MATLALTVPTYNGTQISGAAASGGGDLMPQTTGAPFCMYKTAVDHRST